MTHDSWLTALWGSWARYVYKDCLHRFYRFAVNVMGIQAVDTENEEKCREVALKGIEPDEAQIAELARKCSIASGGKKSSAKILMEADMKKIYEMAR